MADVGSLRDRAATLRAESARHARAAKREKPGTLKRYMLAWLACSDFLEARKLETKAAKETDR